MVYKIRTLISTCLQSNRASSYIWAEGGVGGRIQSSDRTQMSSRIESLSRGLNSGGCATNKCSAFLGGACGFLHTPPRPATEPRCTRHGWAQRELASPRGDQPDIVMSCRRSVVNPRTPLRAPVAAATLRLLLNYRCSSACQSMPILISPNTKPYKVVAPGRLLLGSP